MSKESIDIKRAKKTAEILKKYASAKNSADRRVAIAELQDVNWVAYMWIIDRRYTPMELITRIEKAVKLDKYRPKNISIEQMISSDDLDYINGEFDTFDAKLNHMFKNKEDSNKIRKEFWNGMQNLVYLEQDFSKEWIARLNKHKKLVNAARNANEKDAIDAYNKLFDALTSDFCREYKCKIDTKVITDWKNSDAKPKNKKDWNIANGCSESKREDDKNSCGVSHVRININNIRREYPDSEKLFYKMIGVFVHEIHHALDFQHPRQGALGPQIEYIDRKLYTQPAKSVKENLDSATEISSYGIERELMGQLKKTRF